MWRQRAASSRGTVIVAGRSTRSLYRCTTIGVHMNATAELAAVQSEIERSLQLVRELRAVAPSDKVSTIAGRIEASLGAAAKSVTSAASGFRQQAQHLNELSSVVVGSTIRHF